MKFDVTVEREEYRTHVFTVEADNTEDAYDKAMEEAYNFDFNNAHVDYAGHEVISVREELK